MILYHHDTEIYIYISAVKWLITINHIQNKSFFWHNICMCTVYIYYVYINIHTYSIYFENIYMYIHLYIYILIFYIIYKYEWMMHLYSALCIAVHPKCFTIMWGGGSLLNHHQNILNIFNI